MACYFDMLQNGRTDMNVSLIINYSSFQYFKGFRRIKSELNLKNRAADQSNAFTRGGEVQLWRLGTKFERVGRVFRARTQTSTISSYMYILFCISIQLGTFKNKKIDAKCLQSSDPKLITQLTCRYCKSSQAALRRSALKKYNEYYIFLQLLPCFLFVVGASLYIQGVS